ncbi:MAG: methionyl-tRNA formyltransferase [Desulfatibacillaceae bacterium]|nr:methionyl-tRNA formyltransferase [Desulfatibacillaceae bacterium]
MASSEKKAPKIVFMGTPEFAVPSLKALFNAGFCVAAVVTAQDKPKGRNRKKLFPPPVKEAAIDLGLEVLAPASLKEPGFFETLAQIAPDFLAVAAFGRILPPEILALPKLFCLNVHPSLLPLYRGPAPIQHAILNGDAATGVTIMAMDKGVDTGDILLQEQTPIEEGETAAELEERLARMGARLLVQAVNKTLAKEIVPVAQDGSLASFAPLLAKESGRVEWAKPARQIERLVRAMTPWPGAFTFFESRRIKIHTAALWPEKTGAPPGTVLAASNRGLLVATGDGALNCTDLQGEAARKMPAGDFLRGNPIPVGSLLG